jgi:hypothetical protein
MIVRGRSRHSGKGRGCSIRMRFTLLLMILLCADAVIALQFTELLPNPDGSDNFKEYVRLQGTEKLAGCSIQDAKSSDKLKLLQEGSEDIYIVEDNSTLLPLDGPTIYSAGSAIGNGLDNSYEELKIICKNETLATTAYNISTINGYKEGSAIFWDDGWTGGKRTETTQKLIPEEKHPQEKPVFEIAVPFCNDTLLITVSNASIIAGDRLTFSVISNATATVTVMAQNDTIFEGDTAQFTEFGITAPDTTMLRITAQTYSCDATQRSTRIVAVSPRPAPPIKEVVVQTTQELAAVPAIEEEAPAPKPLPQVTAQVVVDQDSSAIPWIAGFGMVTLIVSAIVFFRAER